MPRVKKGKRGSIINKWGVKITKKEQQEINRLKKAIDKVRKDLQAQLDKDQELRQNINIDKTIVKMEKVKRKKLKINFKKILKNFNLKIHFFQIADLQIRINLKIEVYQMLGLKQQNKL